MNKLEKPKPLKEEIKEVNLIRILGKDIRGDKKIIAGLTNIKGISWAFSNVICKKLGINKDAKIQDLSKEEIKKIEEFAKDVDAPSYLKNRQKDFDDGKDKHILGSDLKLREEFDIKRLKKIKSYKGARHSAGLPVRGQRTKSHFRKNRKKSGAVGVKTKKSDGRHKKEKKIVFKTKKIV